VTDRPDPQKAWRISYTYWPEEPGGIAAAPTRAKARYLAWSQAREAGWTSGFGAFRVVRAPEYDEWAARGNPRGPMVEEYVRSQEVLDA
jgi:hypothetical protein